MGKCELCEEETGSTKFISVSKGYDQTLCKTCFFDDLNGKNARVSEKSGGLLNYEILSHFYLIE
jgi:hypothetical protein